MALNYGVIIESGASDWQIFQQNGNGTADIVLSGHYVECRVLPKFPVTVVKDGRGPQSLQVRVVREMDGSVVIDWIPARLLEKEKWKITLCSVPAGGLYRIETCLFYSSWDVRMCTRGDMRHHLGVGDVFLIAGQSNAAGRSKAPVCDEPHPAVHVMRPNGRWDMASHPLGETTDMLLADNFENHNPGHSPWLHFAKILQREQGYPIGLVPSACGGTPLSWWMDREQGNLLDCAAQLVRMAGGAVRAVLWSQGEGDAGEEAVSYDKRLKTFLEMARCVLGNEKLPFLIVQTNRCMTDGGIKQDRGYGMVRQAQLSLMNSGKNVWLIPSADLPVSDAMHNRSVFDMVIGERCAACVLTEIYGKWKKWKAPVVKKAVVKERQLILFFEGVTQWLETGDVGPKLLPVEAEDEAGFLRTVSYRVVDSDKLMLTMNRKAGRGTKVHGAWRSFPGAVIPSDAGGLPMYSFYGLEVENE